MAWRALTLLVLWCGVAGAAGTPSAPMSTAGLYNGEAKFQVLEATGVNVDFAKGATQTDGSMKSQWVGPDGTVADVDPINKVGVFMDWEHHAIHEGMAYNLNVYSTVTNGAPKYCQFKTGSKYIHLKEKTIVDGTDTMLCSFIESPTVTNGTTAVPSYNRNRNSSNTSSMTIYSDPTAISGGTVLEYDYLFGNALNAAAPHGQTLEWVLKPNTSYIYKLENLTAGTATFLSKLMWYEH